jgi:hypothetical protein
MLSGPAFRFEECTQGEGGACGATFLDTNFHHLLCQKLGLIHRTLLTSERWERVRNAWESGLKRNFDGVRDASIHLGYGCPEVPQIGLREGTLQLTAYLN